jgi:1,4-dihydroxy-2-naphthoyl-CoA hydrolase
VPATSDRPSPAATVAEGDAVVGELADKLGIILLEVTPERLVGTMPVVGNRQPYGLLHGGASAALAETLGSWGAALAAGPDRVAVGIELNVTHHRPATDGLVTGVATRSHAGRSLATFDVVVMDAGGRRVCTGRLTCMLRDTPPGDAPRLDNRHENNEQSNPG